MTVDDLQSPAPYAEHPQDVLLHWLAWRERGAAALVVVTATQGGGVRAPGALMAVSADGAAAGYVSGGCIDADVILHAKASLETGAVQRLRYGEGSPFADIRLPCGGAIELAVLPDADMLAVRRCHARLAARAPARLHFPGLGFEASYAPKLRLRIAGRGADPLALARLAHAAGLEVALQSPNDADVKAAHATGLRFAASVHAQTSLPPHGDDAWTAFVSMLHDPDWEDPLLQQALTGPAFYVGAVGSRATHVRRSARLHNLGVNDADIRRIHGPVGLIPSMRDASMLAVSTLAEIVAAYHQQALAPFRHTALILLAAGGASRFEGGDKLLAPYKDGCVLDHSAALLAEESVAARIAIASPDAPSRERKLNAAGWEVAINDNALSGLASSLQCGIRAVQHREDVDAVLILLADMPAIPADHLHRLQQAHAGGAAAVMTDSGGVLSPPALFGRAAFPALLRLTGDQGAKRVFAQLANTATVSMDPTLALDIDTRADLAAAEACHA